jgi:hypothetical protein
MIDLLASRGESCGYPRNGPRNLARAVQSERTASVTGTSPETSSNVLPTADVKPVLSGDISER